MHVFDLPVEVFILVLKLLEPRELLHSATVCSQWKDLALDIKWREHNVELVEMLRALGPVEPVPGDGQMFRFTTKRSSIQEAVSTAGWKRLNELRRKVTRLQIRKPLALNDINYLADLQHAVEHPRHAFCPELRQLDVKLDGQPEPYAYDFLAGESLAQLNLNWTPIGSHESPRVVASALERLALRSPLLEHIDALRFSSQFVNYGIFPKLRILKHQGPFSMGSWINICAECPLLEVVHIWCLRKEVMDEGTTYTPPATQALPLLLVLRTSEMGDGTLGSYILRTTNMPQLRELEVDLKEQRGVEVATLVSLIVRRSPLLEKLRVRGHNLDWGGFASFTRLRHLELLGNLGSFTTEHVTGIIGKIPNIASLTIGSRSGEIDRTTIAFTPTLLETIAEQCQQLSELDVPLNTLSIPWISEPPTPVYGFKKLETLALDPLHIEPKAMKPFAKYLVRLCPTVGTFETILLHPDETGVMIDVSSDLTEQERSNAEVMEVLFFDVRGADDVPNRASEALA